MALSMDEQRILAEIEEGLARTEPGLAARLSSFGHPGSITTRSARGLVMASFIALIVMVFVSMMLYALAPRRPGLMRGLAPRPASGPAIPIMTPRSGAGGPAPSVAGHAVPAPPSLPGPSN